MISLKKMITGRLLPVTRDKRSMLNVNAPLSCGLTRLKCFVIDADVSSSLQLEGYLRDTPDLEFMGSEQTIEPLAELLCTGGSLPDIVFLDFTNQVTKSLNLARQLMGKACVIFTTADNHFVAESYRLRVVDYLVKPLSYELFLEAVGKCRVMYDLRRFSETRDLLFLKDSLSGKSINVNQHDILYIQSIGNYCKVYFVKGKDIMPHLSLRQLLSRLDRTVFVRVHKSYVVNLNHVDHYDGFGFVGMKNKAVLEVGRTYRKGLKTKIKQTYGA